MLSSPPCTPARPPAALVAVVLALLVWKRRKARLQPLIAKDAALLVNGQAGSAVALALPIKGAPPSPGQLLPPAVVQPSAQLGVGGSLPPMCACGGGGAAAGLYAVRCMLCCAARSAHRLHA